MNIYNPYKTRLHIAKPMLWLVVFMLVNFWVDVNDWHFSKQINDQGEYTTAFDDFDSLYEWIAEDVFDMEEATPEHEGSSDDNGEGKVAVIKYILSPYNFAVVQSNALKLIQFNSIGDISPFLPNPARKVLTPPPNV